jgi:multidrug efflux system membrane fusion protein
MPPAPVVVANAEVRDVPLTINSVGNVEAYSSVQVKSMVTAPILEAHFKQGDFVKKGQLLFTLDSRSFQADLAKAQGQLARDTAAAATAREQARRYTALFKEGVVAKEQHDTMLSSADQLDAAIQADKAAVEASKINLEYTRIYSPISGRAGEVLVYPGNIIKANDATMLAINQVAPIYVSFSVPEAMLPDIRQAMASGQLKVNAVFPDPTQTPVEGKLTFVDNAVDPKTGTINLKAEFANSTNRLWPGQYVNAVLTLATQKNAVVVPTQAVQNGQKGTFVYVATPGKTAEMRPVQLGSVSGNSQIIKSGVNAGEIVVTDGQLRLVPGAKIDYKTAAASAGSTQTVNR